MGTSGTERFDTIVIGGSQAGVATGYYLKQQGRSFVILEGSERVGDGWRKRWDSLRLFTPAKYNKLPGLRFPAKPWTFPTKDEMADYLEAYAATHELPVRTNVWVDSIRRNGAGYVVTAKNKRFEADNVVIATGAFRHGKVPAFAADLDPAITQIHSVDYKNPSQLSPGSTVIVGCGNSGVEVTNDLIGRHDVTIAGKPPGQIPFAHGTRKARYVFLPMVRFMGRQVLSQRTPIGRKVGPKLVRMGNPLIRTKRKDLEAAGVTFVPRATDAKDGALVLEDGRTLRPDNIVWCTGFRYDFSWIDIDVFDDEGAPRHRRGIVEDAPGLYFVGLLFQFSLASDVVTGVARDAKYVVDHIQKAAGSRSSRTGARVA